MRHTTLHRPTHPTHSNHTTNSLPPRPPLSHPPGDVDFSIPAYRDITGMWPHRLAIQWEWSDCSAKVEGPIRMAPKVGGWVLAWWGWLLRVCPGGSWCVAGAISR